MRFKLKHKIQATSSWLFILIRESLSPGAAAGAQRERARVPQQPEPRAAEGDAPQQRPLRVLRAQRRGRDRLQRAALQGQV